jgi:hypothetical protein
MHRAGRRTGPADSGTSKNRQTWSGYLLGLWVYADLRCTPVDCARAAPLSSSLKSYRFSGQNRSPISCTQILRQINAEAYRRAQGRQKRAEYRNMENHSEPGAPAPQQGYYLAHNVFGSPSTPRWVVWCEAGETLPVSGRGYTWRLIDESEDAATDRARRLVPADTDAASRPKAGAVA